MWRAIWKKEFIGVVGNSWYWFACVISPLLILMWILGPELIDRWTADDSPVAVATSDDSVVDMLRARIPDQRWLRIDAPVTANDKSKLIDDDYVAIVELTEPLGKVTAFRIYDDDVGSAELYDELERVLSTEAIAARFATFGADRSAIDAALAPLTVALVRVSADGEVESSRKSVWLAYGVMGAIFVAIMIFGIMVMNAMCREKSSKMIEVVLTCASADDVIIGKVAGVLSAAFIQLVFWAVLVGGGLVIRAQLGGGAQLPGDDSLSSSVAFAMVSAGPQFWIGSAALLVLGLILYMSWFATIGSMLETIEDGQHLQLPINLALDIPILLSFYVRAFPDDAISTTASFVPFFAPLLMPMRMATSSVPLWQVVTCVALLAVFIVFTLRFAAKVYRVGMLMQGQPPSLRQAAQWMRRV